MGFGTAVRTCLAKYVDPRGRARRSEYWWFTLFVIIAVVTASLLDDALNTGFAYPLVAISLALPSLCVSVRRLHDTGRSAWYLLVGIIPLIGDIALLIWFCEDSERRDNDHGPWPKHLLPAA